jgi:hypothetical protein
MFLSAIILTNKKRHLLQSVAHYNEKSVNYQPAGLSIYSDSVSGGKLGIK